MARLLLISGSARAGTAIKNKDEGLWEYFSGAWAVQDEGYNCITFELYLAHLTYCKGFKSLHLKLKFYIPAPLSRE